MCVCVYAIIINCSVDTTEKLTGMLVLPIGLIQIISKYSMSIFQDSVMPNNFYKEKVKILKNFENLNQGENRVIIT